MCQIARLSSLVISKDEREFDPNQDYSQFGELLEKLAIFCQVPQLLEYKHGHDNIWSLKSPRISGTVIYIPAAQILSFGGSSVSGQHNRKAQLHHHLAGHCGGGGADKHCGVASHHD